jgi:hypothetical protein
MNVTFETKHKNLAGKDEWLTPPIIIESLGEFDLDPCSPVNRPWDTAKKHFTKLDDGLNKEWEGRVWCNPPYGNQTGLWLKKCSVHGNAIALTFARTETRMFFDFVWSRASAIFFFKKRLKFHHINGTRSNSAGAPSVLIAYGKENAYALESSFLEGKYLLLQ